MIAIPHLKRMVLVVLALCTLALGAKAESGPANNALPSLQCDITTRALASPACQSSDPDLAVTPPAYQAVRSDPGNAGPPVDAWNYCRYVDNQASGAYTASIFVPFHTSPEWIAFINAVNDRGSPVGNIAHLVTCSRPWTPPSSALPADTVSTDLYYCNSPVAEGTPTKLPYSRTNATGTSTQQYQCSCTSGTTWVETVTGTFLAGVSADVANGSSGWSAIAASVAYSGTMPAGCTKPSDGECGSANGQSFTTVSSLEAANLCSAGTFNSLTATTTSATGGAGSYTWKCSGSNYGTDAVCSATTTCNPDSIANGTVDPTTCAVTCASGYYSGTVGTVAACVPVPGCGSANGQPSNIPPSGGGVPGPTHLCSGGFNPTPPSDVDDLGTWVWSCMPYYLPNNGAPLPPTVWCSAPVVIQ